MVGTNLCDLNTGTWITDQNSDGDRWKASLFWEIDRYILSSIYGYKSDYAPSDLCRLLKVDKVAIACRLDFLEVELFPFMN
jgi:hypothetical protein